ncbi:triadin-like [Python bivittatus]|uniref:Triadin-like n=1 Tax=Python bivittatus TaxID=176946 RepID=A0A9F5IGV5_PYTBI|nr:triadin-like [Python bivittatus]
MIKQTKNISHSAITGKEAEHKPPKQEVLGHEKGVHQAKPERPEKPSAEIRVADKKKAEKSLKEKKEKYGKTVEKIPLKVKHAKVPTEKEAHFYHNMTTEKYSKATKTGREYSEVTTIKKEKSAVRYYQCVFVSEFNGYTPQYPITPEKPSDPKLKARKQ